MQGIPHSNRSRTDSSSPSRDSTPTNVPTYNNTMSVSASNTFQPIHSITGISNQLRSSQSERSNNNSGNNSGNNSAGSSYGGYNGTSMFATFIPAVVPTMPHSAAIEAHRSSPVLPPEEVSTQCMQY
jgi:hypothetical protein